MEHQEALDTHAAEGYLLGDLTAAEYAAFEEHFADCDECFADVRDTATVVAAVRVKNPAQAKGGQQNRIPWFAAAASVSMAMLSTIAYQGYQLAQLRAPRVLAAQALLPDQRGPEKTNEIKRGNGPFIDLQFDITLEKSPSYVCKVVDAQGKTVGKPLTVGYEQAGDPVTLEFSSKDLQPGEYSLVVTGTGGVSEQVQRFTVR